MHRNATRLIFNPLTHQVWIGLEGESGGQADPPADQITAPEQEQTATPDAETTKTPESEQENPEEKPEKTFTQAELDAIVTKRLAKQERQIKRELQQVAAKPEPGERPKPEQFETWEDYAEALSDHKVEEKTRNRETQQQQNEVLSAHAERMEEAREKFDDFDQVALADRVQITNAMGDAIVLSDIGPDIAYHLGLNPKEAERISKLHPLNQIKEIGKIEAKLIAEPLQAKKTSSAPDPITPVNSRGGAQTFDTTDPRSIKAMSTSDWIAADRKREMEKRKARAF